MIEGLKKKPQVAVPIIQRRLKAKLDEWMEARTNFNKLWREQNEKHYTKSLQTIAGAFKQMDARRMRSKTLLNEAETIYEEVSTFYRC